MTLAHHVLKVHLWIQLPVNQIQLCALLALLVNLVRLLTLLELALKVFIAQVQLEQEP